MALSKLAEQVDGKFRIKSDPPLLLPLRDLADNRQLLFDRFELVDIAMKAVGVGSVGTRCMIVLFQGRDQGDPLFLQAKEATTSVLEDHLPKSQYSESGQRVVAGQRLMQASSDIFLGWDTVAEPGQHFYWRQFHDMKGSAEVEAMNPDRMGRYAALCGATLAHAHAHAHARSGDPIAIAAYLGSSDTFDKAVAEFGLNYAVQNERDYRAFTNAIKSDNIEAADG